MRATPIVERQSGEVQSPAPGPPPTGPDAASGAPSSRRPTPTDILIATESVAGPTSMIWKIPDSGHTDGYATDPTEYESSVIGFLDSALDPVEP